MILDLGKNNLNVEEMNHEPGKTYCFDQQHSSPASKQRELKKGCLVD